MSSATAIFGTQSENLKTEMQEYLKTAGPEADEVEVPSPVKAPAPAGTQPPLRDPDAARKANACIAALGGKTNMVRDDKQICEAALKSEGIAEVVKLDSGKTIHLLAGLNADQYAAEMRGQARRLATFALQHVVPIEPVKGWRQNTAPLKPALGLKCLSLFIHLCIRSTRASG